jgi:plasmid stabilization system protein ParE
MKYRVITLRQAENDARAISAWIAQRSAAGAARWLDAYEAALKRLTHNPEGCSVADEDHEVPDRTLRQFLFKTRRGRTFRGIFTVEGDEVRVLRIRGADQAPLTPDDFPF